MQIFLTGGCGFLGKWITRKLLARGWHVLALARNPDSDGAKIIKEMGATIVPGDITERESMRETMRGADVVIHNAGWYELGITKRQHELMHSINVGGTKNTLGLAAELGIPKIIYISSMLAYGHTGDEWVDETFQRRAAPMNYYEETKSEAHEFANKLQKEGAPIVIVCPGGIIGPGDHSGTGYLMRMYIRYLLPPILFGKTGRRSIVHVEDAAEAIIRSVEQGLVGETYILSSGVTSYSDMISLWQTTQGGSKVTLFWMPKNIAVAFSALCEPIERIFNLPLVFNRDFANIAFVNWSFSGTKAERELGIQFRNVEQVYLDTLDAERKIIRQKNQA